VQSDPAAVPSEQSAPRSWPAGPPFTIRAPLLTPLEAGGSRYERDALLSVDQRGGISRIAAWSEAQPAPREPLLDLRPHLLLPGLVDLHAHLPQLPNAGLGAGLDLLTWLERYIFPLERDFDEAAAERLAPAAYRAFASAGTTTVVLYGAVYERSLDVAFRAAEVHGIRAVIGKVMMDRLRYDPKVSDDKVLELSLRQSADLISRWHGRDEGRLRYAVTPRFAVSCSEQMLRESAALARSTGTYWQTHLAEDRAEIDEVLRLFPEASDYTDVYDRAGGLGPQAILAHGIHLSEREIARLAQSGTRIAHCPSSNLFLSSGAMPLARYLEAGLLVGLGSDIAGGPDLSLFAVMRAGAYTQSGLRTMLDEKRPSLSPLDWLRMGTIEGARALQLNDRIGSLEEGKEADFIAVDPRLTAPLQGQVSDDPAELMSRLIFRARPDMVRGAWVRGRLLAA
jgi:guanine deaminase